MPQVSQSSSNFDNRIDPTFGLGNLAKAADTVTENRRKQVGIVNAVRQTLATKGVKLKGTITVGEDGMRQFSDPADREAYYDNPQGGKYDRSKQGAGTNAGVELKRADVGAMQARTDGIIAPQDNLANQIINRKVPTTVPGTTMPALPSGTPPTLPTLGSAPTVTPGAAGGAAAAVKSVMAANGVAPAPTVAPAGSTSAHASSNASSAASSSTSMTGGGYSETQHDYFENTKDTDIAVHDDVQMGLVNLAMADLNSAADAAYGNSAAPVVYQNLMKQYSAVTDSINAALGKQGTEQTMTTGGSTTVNRQGIGANVSNNMQSQTINNIGGSNNTTGSAKAAKEYFELKAQDKAGFKIEKTANGTYKIPGNTGYDITTTEIGMGRVTPQQMADKYTQYWEQQVPGSGWKAVVGKNGNLDLTDDKGKIRGRLVIDTQNAYREKSDGNIEKVDIKGGSFANDQYTKMHLVFVNPDDPKSNKEFEADPSTIQFLSFQLPR